ncbi:MAG: tetratricopeptide repeat protein, partial [Synechococcus sp.]
MSHSVEKTRGKCDNHLSKQPRSLSSDPHTRDIEIDRFSTAVQHHRNGQLEQAEQLYKHCIVQNQNPAEAHSNLGVICLSNKRLDEGIQHFKTALSIRPTYLSALKNLGNALFSQNKPKAAIEHYEQALSLSPNDIEILVSLANAAQASQDYDRAISYYHQAIEQSPNNPELPYSLAQTLKKQGNIDVAIQQFHQALSHFPNNFKLTAGLASSYLYQDRIETATTHYLEALKLNPGSASAWGGLGLSYHAMGRFRDGISAYYKALEIEPNNARIHTSFAILLMLVGEFREGWQSYQYRFKYKPDLMRSPSQLEQWDGDFDCDEIILIDEQGIGDTFQFIRYAQLLRQHFSKVTVCVPTKLIELLQYSLSDPGISIHHSFNYALGTTKARWVPMLSVPQYFGITRDTPILNPPYLSAPPEHIEHWRQQLQTSPDKMLIGLNWQGNPAQEYLLMKGRSFHLEQFAWLSEIPGIELVSLQKGKGSEQLETCSFADAFIANQAKVNDAWDYVDTAAIFMNCDLIITSDTSVAHLAGALGKPTWILLQSIPEWRWGLAGKNTAWYPSAQLFRQTEPGDW